jgi:hypothetical protein
MADDQRRCCILGLCCPPGSAEQRQALKKWLFEKVYAIVDDPDPEHDALMIDAWLDELPWKEDAQ